MGHAFVSRFVAFGRRAWRQGGDVWKWTQVRLAIHSYRDSTLHAAGRLRKRRVWNVLKTMTCDCTLVVLVLRRKKSGGFWENVLTEQMNVQKESDRSTLYLECKDSPQLSPNRMPLLESQLTCRTLRFAKGEIFGLSFQEEWYVLGADDDFVVTAYVGNNLQDHVLDTVVFVTIQNQNIDNIPYVLYTPVGRFWCDSALQLWCLPSEYRTSHSAQDAYKGQSIRSIYSTEINWNELKSTEGDQITHLFSW